MSWKRFSGKSQAALLLISNSDGVYHIDGNIIIVLLNGVMCQCSTSLLIQCYRRVHRPQSRCWWVPCRLTGRFSTCFSMLIFLSADIFSKLTIFNVLPYFILFFLLKITLYSFDMAPLIHHRKWKFAWMPFTQFQQNCQESFPLHLQWPGNCRNGMISISPHYLWAQRCSTYCLASCYSLYSLLKWYYDIPETHTENYLVASDSFIQISTHN